MKNLLHDIEEILLMGPGPSSIAQPVYNALARKTLGHLDPYFIKIMDGIKSMQQEVMQTKNRLTFPVSGTGSAGMESCFVNLIEPGDAVLILINGYFAMRMQEMATRLGADVDTLEFEWGTPVNLETVERQLKLKQYKIVAVVHAETSTGVLNPVPELGRLLDQDTLFLVDAVTSLGGIEVKVDDWRIDAVYSGSQKCLSGPPGLSPVSFSDKAVDVVTNRKKPVPNWYLDMSLVLKYWEGGKRAYHHTAPINNLYGLYQALFMALEEGLDNVFTRHAVAHRHLVSGLEALEVSLPVAAAHRLPMLNAISIPAGIDDVQGRLTLLNKYKIEVGGGLGAFAGKVWRIGLMGHTARSENVDRFLTALKEMLN